MGLTDLDATLRRLTDAAARAGANLMELDRDDTRRLLEATVLEGESAARWHDANADWPTVWTWYTKLTAALDDATTLRGKRPWLSPDKEARLLTALTSPSIEIERRHVPILDRALLGSQHTTTSCTPDEVLALMADAFDRMRAILGATANAWNDLVPRVADARTALDALADEAHGLATEIAPEIARLRPRCDTLLSSIFADPLSIDGDEVDTLDRAVNALREQVAGAADLRVELDERRARVQTLLTAAREAVAEAETAHELVMAKITAPAVPIPAPVPRSLADQLVRVDELADRGQWHAAHTALVDWTASVDALIARAHADAAANRAPIEERNRLRGRLDAYQAVAKDHGRLEDRHLAELHRAAEALLYVAPCDLEEAAASVRRYQEAIPRSPGSEGRRS